MPTPGGPTKTIFLVCSVTTFDGGSLRLDTCVFEKLLVPPWINKNKKKTHPKKTGTPTINFTILYILSRAKRREILGIVRNFRNSVPGRKKSCSVRIPMLAPRLRRASVLASRG